MCDRGSRFSLAALIGVFALAWLPAQAAAQASAPAAKTAASGTVAGGQPDFEGYWQGNGYTSVDAAYDLEKGMSDAERIITGRPASATPSRGKAIVDPPDGRIPYQPWALALRDKLAKGVENPTRLEDIDSLTRCFQMGVPRQSFLGGFRAVQYPGYVVLVYDGTQRVIALDGRPHLPANIKLWSGDSVGHWEGRTLVVDVTNLNEHAWYDVAGNFHSSELHLVERWTLVDKDTIRYEVTSYDPRVFTQPWTLRNEYKRNADPTYEQWENGCFEGERGVQLMLGANKKP
jgi:hypothetical protein